MEPEDDDSSTKSGPTCPGCSSAHTMESLENPDERLFSCTDCGMSWFENSRGDKRILIQPKKP